MGKEIQVYSLEEMCDLMNTDCIFLWKDEVTEDVDDEEVKK